jgi:hypothetical protein
MNEFINLSLCMVNDVCMVVDTRDTAGADADADACCSRVITVSHIVYRS